MKIIPILLVLSSCTHLFIPTIRTPYELRTKDEFLITNIYTDPTRLKVENSGVEIQYDIIVKNLSERNRTIDLTKALVLNKERPYPMPCKSFKEESHQFEVKPNQHFRILCYAKVPQIKHQGDAKLIIAIPLEKEPVLFTYIVRAEELK